MNIFEVLNWRNENVKIDWCCRMVIVQKMVQIIQEVSHTNCLIFCNFVHAYSIIVQQWPTFLRRRKECLITK
jgi:hypothetical protein